MKRLFRTFKDNITIGYYYVRYLLIKDVLYKPNEVVYVPLSKINTEYKVNMKVLKRYSKYMLLTHRNFGLVKSFDPQKRKIPFVDFKVFELVFVQGKSWKETSYYNEFLKQGVRSGCHTWQDYELKFLTPWESLYQDIKINGYKSQNELGNKRKIPREIEIALSKEGHFIFMDGRHRLAIAKIMDIDKIPVIINYAHYELYNEIIKFYGTRKITPKLLIKYCLDRTSDSAAADYKV